MAKGRKGIKKKGAAMPAPRNPFVTHVRLKRSGAHDKSKKSLRRQEKIRLQKEFF